MSTQKKTLHFVLITIIVLALVFLGWQYISLSQKLQVAEKVVAGQQTNKKVLAFSELFVTNVLQGGSSVSFDQRLQLENAVRDINDPKIYAAWQNFTNAKDQAQIQQNFYVLFSLLLKKIEA